MKVVVSVVNFIRLSSGSTLFVGNWYWWMLGRCELSQLFKWSWNCFRYLCHFSSCDLLHEDGSV